PVSIDLAESAAHMAHDAGLFAIMDHVVPDDMAAYEGLVPSAGMQRPQDHFLFALGAAFRVFAPDRGVARSDRRAQADADAFGFIDMVVFDNPAFAPVRPDEPFLKGGRRRPLG